MTANDIVSLLNERVWTVSWLDFYIFSYEKNKLVIAGSDDFSYYHNVEIECYNPIYMKGNFEWTCDTTGELASVGDAKKKLLFMNDDGIALEVIADKFFINFDTVFYYYRDNLIEGQRMAAWVKK